MQKELTLTERQFAADAIFHNMFKRPQTEEEIKHNNTSGRIVKKLLNIPDKTIPECLKP